MRATVSDRGAARALIIFSAALFGLVSGGEALASPGCTALNGVVSDPVPGALVGTGFSSGDQITVSIISNFIPNPSPLYIYDDTTFSNIVGPSYTNTISYTVPTTTTHTIFAGFGSYAGGSPTANVTCTPAGSSSNTDSQKLRSLQIAGTNTAATISEQVIPNQVAAAIDAAFANGTAPVTPGPNGLRLNFAAEPQRDAATQQALDALAYAGDGGMVYKVPPPAPSFDRPWSAWADLRGTGFDQSSASTHEEQINVTGGIGRKLGPDLLVGLFTGYEKFSFTMETIAGKLTGDGGTIGGYTAWRFADHWRVEGMLGWTDMHYNGTAGTAAGSFTGSRWLSSGGFTGTYRWGAFVFEPSARINAMWEHDNSYTDTLGTAQGVNNFSASRVSAGNQFGYPWQASSTLAVAPYVGLYTDYRFSTSTALPVAVPFVGIKNGWSERVTAGATFGTGGRAGPSLSLGGELGGLGAGYDIWSVNARANWPF